MKKLLLTCAISLTFGCTLNATDDSKGAGSNKKNFTITNKYGDKLTFTLYTRYRNDGSQIDFSLNDTEKNTITAETTDRGTAHLTIMHLNSDTTGSKNLNERAQLVMAEITPKSSWVVTAGKTSKTGAPEIVLKKE